MGRDQWEQCPGRCRLPWAEGKGRRSKGSRSLLVLQGRELGCFTVITPPTPSRPRQKCMTCDQPRDMCSPKGALYLLLRELPQACRAAFGMLNHPWARPHTASTAKHSALPTAANRSADSQLTPPPSPAPFSPPSLLNGGAGNADHPTKTCSHHPALSISTSYRARLRRGRLTT